MSEEIKSDKGVVPSPWRRAAACFHSEGGKDVALAAVANSGGALPFMVDRLMDDKAVILAAMAQSGCGLWFV